MSDVGRRNVDYLQPCNSKLFKWSSGYNWIFRWFPAPPLTKPVSWMHLLVLIKYQINIKMYHSHNVLLVLRNNQIDIKMYHSHLIVLWNNQIDKDVPFASASSKKQSDKDVPFTFDSSKKQSDRYKDHHSHLTVLRNNQTK